MGRNETFVYKRRDSREGNGSEERRFVTPAWWILFIADGWFGGDSLYYVPSHGVALLHQAVSIAQRVAC